MSQNNSLTSSTNSTCLNNLWGIIQFYLFARLPCDVEHTTQREESAGQYHRIAKDVSGDKSKSKGSNYKM